MNELKGTAASLSNEMTSLYRQIEELERRCTEAEEALDAIRRGAVDALVIYSDEDEKIFTIHGAETTYRLLVESINEGAATLVEDGTILYCNRRFAEMLATPLEAVIGTSIHQYLPPENKASFSSLLLRGLEENCRDEVNLLRQDGKPIPVMVSLNNFSAEGSPGVCLIATDLTERRQAEMQLARQNQELRALSEAEHHQRELAEGLAQSAIALTSSLQLEDILSILLDQIRRNIPFQGADITLIEGRKFRVAGYRGFEDQPASIAVMYDSYNLEDFPLFERVCETLQPLLIPDTLEADGWHVIPGLEWVRSYLAVPLVINEQVTGIINLISEQPGFFTTEILERLRSFAASAALALHNAQLYNAELTARQAAETLSATAQALAQTLDLDHILKTLLANITAITHADTAYVAMFEGETYLAARAAQGYERWTDLDQILSIKIDVSSNLTLQRLISTRKSLLVPDTAAFTDWQVLPELDPIHSWLLVPLVAGDKVIGVVALGKAETGYFTQHHIRWAEALAGQAVMAIQNAWLFEQVRAGQERFQALSRRLVEIQESERRYIARELHDEASQALTSLIVGLQLIEKETASQPARIEAARMNQVLDSVMENLHRLAVDLRPASLDFVGLTAALQQYVQTLKERSLLEIRLKTIGFEAERLAPEVETTLYRIVQEAANNVIRHAQASHMDVILERGEGHITVIVEDDGTGFDVDQLDKSSRLGLMGMQERAEMLGGRLEIESEPGQGTTIIVEVPDGDTHPDRR